LKERILKRLDTHPAFCELPAELLQEWRRKLLAASIGTIHQFCLQLIDAARPAGQRKAFKVVDEALEETLKAERLRIFLRERFLAEDPEALRLLKAFGIGKLRELIFARVEMFHAEGPAADLPESEPAEADLLLSLESLARPFLEGLDRRKAELGWMSFSDMERRALELLNRPNEALRKFLKPLQHFLVDEFQDTSPVQIRLLQALRQVRGPGARPCLFAVGDPKQSIYRFRDVDRHLIARTQEEILRDGGKRFDSSMNWRSAPVLLDLVNRYSAAAFPADLPSGPTRPADPAAFARIVELEAGEKKASAEEQAELEALAVGGAIAELLKEVPAEEIAVLYRTSGAVEALIRVLQERGIPYCIRGGQNLFERQEIFDLHRLIYFLGNPKDDLSLVGVLRSPLFLLSDAALFFLGLDRRKEESFWEHLSKAESLSRLRSARPEEVEKFLACREELGRLMALTASQSPSRLLERLIRRGGWGELYALASGEEQRWLAIEQWLDWLKTLEEDEAPLTWNEVSRRLRETAELQPNKTPLGDLIAARGSVQLLTLHKAKGLEFDTVFMVGMNKTPKPDYPLLQRLGGQAALKVPDPREEKGLRPSQRYLAIQEIHKSEGAEENKRLLYVGLTRAKRRLFVVLQPGNGTKGTLQHLLKQSLGEDWMKWRGELPRSEAGRAEAPCYGADLVARGFSPVLPLSPTIREATVSELETFQVCPLKHHFAYRLQVPQEPAVLRPP
ncbi:MAG TPA: 3'-5' exonuclease, partial [bacterium]|nr:3'-5' exonuclease [bacterium]